MQEYTQSAFYYIRLLLKWKVQFIVITLLAIAASALFSSEWFIKPRYKSSAIVYPANVLPYSEESNTEQILQMFQSADIRNAVIRKFDLAKHYGVDTTGKEGHAKLIGTYLFFVSISKTQYESVEIEVTDTDPQLASDMVKEIVFQLNKKISTIHKQKSREVGIVLRKQMNLKRTQLDSLDTILHELRVKYGILDYNIQVKEVTKAYVKGLNSGRPSKDIDVMMRNLEEKGGEYYKAKVFYDGLLQAYTQVSNDYDNVQKELNKEFTYTYAVSDPAPSDKKSYPVRWLIVVISVISANMFLFLLIIINDYRKRVSNPQ